MGEDVNFYAEESLMLASKICYIIIVYFPGGKAMENAGMRNKSWFKFPMVFCGATTIELKTFKSMSNSECFIDIESRVNADIVLRLMREILSHAV